MTSFVKDIVRGEQALVVSRYSAAADTQSGRVEEAFALAGRIAVDKTDHYSERIVRQRRHTIELPQIAVDEISSLEEITRRITDGRQLGEDNEVRSSIPSLVHGLLHEDEVGVEGADSVVELGDSNSHRSYPRERSVARIHRRGDEKRAAPSRRGFRQGGEEGGEMKRCVIVSLIGIYGRVGVFVYRESRILVTQR